MSSLREKVDKHYYPYTNECPIDGRKCKEQECKFFIESKRCWLQEFNKIPQEIFGDDILCDYVHIRDKSNNWFRGVEHLKIDMRSSNWSDEKRGWVNEGDIYIQLEWLFSSCRLAEKIKERFDKFKDWKIEGHCWDGGDDHTLETMILGGYERKKEIVKYITELKEMIPEIMQAVREIDTCQICHERREQLKEYGKIAACYGCREKIVEENIERYYKE
jgi:hypothetical protein